MALNYGNVDRGPATNREKLIELIALIHKLPMIQIVRHEAAYVNLEADKWNLFLEQVAVLGANDAERNK